MSNANIGLGLARAASNTQDYIRNKPIRDLRLQEAKSSQALAEKKFTDYQSGSGLRQSKQNLELEQTKQQLKSIQEVSLRKDTFSSFDRYEQSKNIKDLNNWLVDAKKTPQGQRMHRDVVRLDKLTRTPQTESMLRQAGIHDLDGYFANPDENANFVLATGPDGEQSLKDMDKVYQAMGYTRYADERALGNMTARARRQQMAQSGMLYKDMTAIERSARAVANELGIPYNEALDMVNKSKRSTGSSTIERLADGFQKANPELSREEAIEKASKAMRSGAGSILEREIDRLEQESPDLGRDEIIAQAKKNTQPSTSVQKNLQSAEDARAKLNKLDIFNADMTDKDVRRSIGPHIVELEKFTGKSLSNEDKRAARQFRELTHLGDLSEGLTDEQTGVIDNMLHGLKQYFTDNVTGVEATTAYETIRNAVRHDLFGATLPAGEIAAFNKSMGTLGRQTGPVLQQLASSMKAVKNKLQSIYDMNDEMIAQYYLGSSLEEIDQVIERVEARIATTTKQGTLTIKDVQAQPQGDFQQLSPENKTKRMDEIFSGSNF